MAVIFLILRVFHILAGVFWAGVTFFGVFSLGPTARSAGPEGGRFMQRLNGPSGRFNTWMATTATLTAVTGALLYLRIAFNVGPNWFLSSQGITLSVAAFLGLAGYLHGTLTLRPTNIRIGQLGQEIAASGGPPSPAQLAEMQVLQEKSATHSGITGILIALAVVGMAALDYLPF